MTWSPRANDLLLKALDLRSEDARRKYLDDACAGDAALRAEVESLLQASVRAGSFLESPLFAPHLIPTRDEPPISERPGTVIGPYKLLEQIGEGGFGVVFMAEQQQPIRRKVAVKVLKPGMDTRQVIARFEAERQALALMDHANIAKVFDGGETASGRPYFVMELVRGVPITEFCDQNHLPIRERLVLFLCLCQAVQHAHQKGVIHRDLKPSNVMVTMHDTVAVVKVIDFGIAKSAGQQLTDKTLYTNFAQLIGTPMYMSPEQAQMTGLDVDTRSDIYSLGVLLYELLTGTTPFDKERLHEVGLDEIRRIIREEEPAKPSTRLSTLGRVSIAVSAIRRSDPKKLSRLMRGELDWIVMKALEKDRNRRYETANSFALDVQRYLNDEPVQACPPSASYRLRKFVRRNKGPVLAASLVVLALVVGVIGTTWSLIRATTAEADTLKEAQQKEIALTASRQSERARAEQLWEALIAEARATRLSRRSGQRFKSLDSLRQAAQLAHTLELPAEKLHQQRNAAIAALAVPDLFLADPWNSWPADAYLNDFDEDHTLYARSDRQGVCSIHRVADDVEIHRLPGLGTPAAPFLSRDGKFVAVVHGKVVQEVWRRDLALHVWQLEGGTPRRILSEANAGFGAFHPHVPQIAVIYNDGAIGLFEMPSGRKLSRLAPDTLTRELTIALHPTEPLAAVTSYFGSVVQLRDVRTGKVLSSLPQGTRPASVAWHPDGRTLAVGLAEACQIRLYDRTTLHLFRTLQTASTASWMVFNHAGDRLVANGWGNNVELFDVGTGQKLFATTSQLRPPPHFRRNDRRLAGAIQDGKLGIWQVGDSREYRTLVHPNLPQGSIHEGGAYRSAAVDPEGRLLAITTTAGFGLWDLASGSELAFIPTNDRFLNLAVFEPSGTLLTLCATGLFRWPIRKDLASEPWVIGPPARLPLPLGNALGQSRDGRIIVTCDRAVAGQEPYAGGWILHADRPDKPIRLDAGSDIGDITISPDGQWAATTTHPGGSTKIWNARDGKLVKQLSGTGCPRFSPDGRWLSTAVDGGRLFAVGTWEPGPKVAAGTFSTDSKLLAVATAAGIRLIDPAGGGEIALLEDPNLDPAGPPVFTPDGTKLIALNPVHGAHVWDLRLLRRQLKEMGMDWDWPEFAEDAEISPPPLPSAPPVVRVLGAGLILDWTAQGHALLEQGKWVEAVARLRKAIEVDPRNVHAHFYLGYALCQQDKVAEAIACHRAVLAIDPSYPGSNNTLAWILATCAVPKLRNADEAVKLARKAVELAPKNGNYWNTLGAAHYRAGNRKEAIAALEKAMQLRGADSYDWFFLAMAHWQLGEKEKARRWFDKAVEWMDKNIPDKNVPKAKELGRFRVEAAELLKIEAKKK